LAEASATATMQAQMLSYSRAQGVFGGVSLSGTSLSPDNSDNAKLYGKKVSGTEIFDGTVKPPPSAHQLIAELEKRPKESRQREVIYWACARSPPKQ
jgi:lipid-binding SYLF domain-containing protein